MDATHFDRLARILAASATRRGIGRLLAAFPLAATLTALVDGASDAARRRHRRTLHQSRTERRDRLQEQRKKKHKKKCAKAGQATSKKRKKCCIGLVKDGSGRCAASCTPVTCAPPACGTVPDGCGGTLDCGCPATSLCLGGTCLACDVCTSGCSYATVQAAVADPNGPATIHICAGTYPEHVTIDRNVSLIGAGDGNGVGETILDGTGSGRVIGINAGLTVALQSLRITGGKEGGGGGINNFLSTMTLTRCTVSGNMSNDSGGGILSSGTLSLTDSTVSGNTAQEHGGGIFSGYTLNLTRSTITGNTAGFNGGGIYHGNSAATATLDAASRVTGNQANLSVPFSGGGIYNDGSTVTLSSTENVTGNTPHNCGGAVVLLCVD